MARDRSDAESIFHKKEEDMSEMERMMAEILGEQNKEGMENIESSNSSRSASGPIAAPAPPQRPRKMNSPKENSSSEPVKNNYTPSHANSSGKTDKSRSKKSAGRKKKSGFPVGILLAVIVLLVIGVLVYSKVFRDFASSFPGAVRVDNSEQIERDVPTEEETAEMAAVSFPPDMVFPTPEPEESLREDGTLKVQPPAGSIVIMSGTEVENSAEGSNEENPDTAVEHRYEFYKEDVSWTAAQQRCLEKGGHLAVISNEDELNEVIRLAAENGIQKVWIGCHRENGSLIWENGETTEYYVWGKGEPSLIDSGDKVAEDYLLLWRFNGSWVYNDSRNDPVRDYPAMYSGQIGYVCEYGM